MAIVQKHSNKSLGLRLTRPSASSLSTSRHEPCIWNCVMSSVMRLQAYPMLMAVSCKAPATAQQSLSST
jgi:hypothetical protein